MFNGYRRKVNTNTKSVNTIYETIYPEYFDRRDDSHAETYL